MPLEAVSTINYVDNDGRFIVVELVHGLAVLGFIVECNNIFVCTWGQVDIFGKHIVVEIVMETYVELASNALEQL